MADQTKMTRREAVALAFRHAKAGIPAGPIAISWDEAKQGTAKRPLTRHGHDDFTTDLRELVRVFNDTTPRSGEVWGVGLRPGPAGYVVLDVDTKGSHDGAAALAKLEAEHGALPEHPVVITASGGRHEWLRKPAGAYVGNQGFAEGIDIRADAGWVVAPGVTTPWGSWALQNGHGLTDSPEAPEWAVARLNTTRPAEPARGTGGSWSDVDRASLHPGELAALEALEALGGHSAFRASDGTIRVTRPGKGSGTSAQVSYNGPDVVQVFSSDWEGLPAGTYDAERLSELASMAALMDGETGGTSEEPEQSIWVDLGPYLDGSYTPPEPEIGAARQPDGKRLLYAGKWHTLIGLTGCGKTWFACAHVAAELLAGATVTYAHFEEPSPAGTVSRLLSLGVPADVIKARLRWMDLERRKDYPGALAALDPAPSLVVLDGINAACGTESPSDVETVTKYRNSYVNPATRLGAAVLSLGHPVKDMNRQGERHGYGSTAWLDLADGVGLRLEACSTRITRGAKGTASIYSVKDRYGGVEQGEPDADRKEGWKWLGTLSVDDTAAGGTRITILAPVAAEAAPKEDPVAELAEAIVLVLSVAEGHRYESQRDLAEMLREHQGRGSRKEDVGAALVRLENQGRLQRPRVAGNKPRPGWLTEAGLRGSQDPGTTGSEGEE